MIDLFIQNINNILILTFVYASLGIGYTMFFGTIGLINFSHGEVFMLGGFTALFILKVLNYFGISNILVNCIFIIIGVSLFCGSLGFVIEKFAFKPVRNYSRIILLITSVAISILIREIFMLIIPNGANPFPFPNFLFSGYFIIGSTKFHWNDIIMIIISIIIICSFSAIIKKTRFGREMRAISSDFEVSQMMGINVERVISYVFIIGAIIGGIAGVMYSLTYNIIKYNIGIMMGLKGFTAAVIGGLRGVKGVLGGALILAVVEIMIPILFKGGSTYQDVGVFAILILFLIFKPEGLIGKSKVNEK